MKTKSQSKAGGKSASKKRGKRIRHTPSLNLPKPRADVAGADIGAREIALCVPEGSDPQPVRIFATFTENLLEAVAWLQRCGVRSVAMESTALYWLPFAQLLAEGGIEVVLVNARHVRHLPGRKSDVSTASGCNTCTASGCCGAASARGMNSARCAASPGTARASWRRSAIRCGTRTRRSRK